MTASAVVRGLFQRQIAGDDALLGLSALRFRQAGMGAELYAETTGGLDRLLPFVPESGVLPTVHLDRRVDLLDPAGRSLVASFRSRFAGRVAGLVVHDRPGMAARLEATALALRALVDTDGAGPAPTVYLEYANGMEPEQFVQLAESITDVDGASVCVDVGHVGIRQARREISRRLGSRGAPALFDPDLAQSMETIQDAMDTALGTLTAMIDSLGTLPSSVHFHLHDGHPLTSGPADHLGFLTRVPIPFSFRGRFSLPQLYGPHGLATILRHAQRMAAQPTYTLEIHRVEGRLPLRDAQPMFAHWVDLTNAERVNYWLSVLAEHHGLVSELLRSLAEESSSSVIERGVDHG